MSFAFLVHTISCHLRTVRLIHCRGTNSVHVGVTKMLSMEILLKNDKENAFLSTVTVFYQIHLLVVGVHLKKVSFFVFFCVMQTIYLASFHFFQQFTSSSKSQYSVANYFYLGNECQLES